MSWLRSGCCLVSFLMICVACGKGDDPGGGGDSGGGGAAAVGGDPAGSGGNGPGGESIDGEGAPVCGNGIVEGDEECDDGNQVEGDGCTTLCTFTCTVDDDCDDLEPCNGKEVCGPEGVCMPGPGGMSDGEQCDDNASCREGKCVPHACGNGYLEDDEECDDGDSDDSNGCTGECLFTCFIGEDETEKDAERGCANDCNQTSVCDSDTHTCSPGNPLPDNALCDDGRGYCVDGRCVASVCGDGTQEPNEECDLGEEQNGAEGSTCSADCTLGVCGDGIINGLEQCDDGVGPDGVPVSLDGCDARCRVEIVFRGTGMGMNNDPAPDFCVYHDSANQGNSFANMFPDPGLRDSIDQAMSDTIGTGEMVYLFHVLDVDDPTAVAPDPLVKMGMAYGMADPTADWANTPDKLDFPVLVYRDSYDDELRPKRLSEAELVVENGRLYQQSPRPYDMAMESSRGTFHMYDVMVRIEIDPARSKIASPPETADGVLLPETVGGGPDNGPTGVMCGAMSAAAFAEMGIPRAELIGLELPLLQTFCIDQGSQITTCAEGQSPTRGECSSFLDLMQMGCSSTNLLTGEVTWYLKKVGEPDADTDGDGVNDAYSMVQKIAGQRVRVVGFAEGDPPTMGMP